MQPLRAELGEQTVSMDEMTGIQALERQVADQPMRPGKRERQEFEYVRHGTQTLIASFDVATGQVVKATIGDTRTPCRLSGSYATTDGDEPQCCQMASSDGLLKYSSVRIIGSLCRSN